MRGRTDTTCWGNTRQKKKEFLSLFFVCLCVHQVCARPDFIDSMSKQFFGFMSDDNGQPQHQRQQQQQYQPTPDPFAQMFGSASQPVPQRPPNQNYPNHHHPPASPPQRQGYYAPPHAVQQQVHLPYSGPPPVYGQQQGFGQRNPNVNETKTDGYPSDNPKPQHPYPPQHQAARHYPPVEYHHHHQPQVVEYHQPPETVVEYQTQHHPHPPQQVEYHHIAHQPAVVEQHGPTVEIHAGAGHGHHEPPAHVEYHHPPKVEYHHYTTHKPRKFHLSFNEPSPDYRIIDKHLKLPPVKFRFHINPKIVITSNTKDPLDKKHHDDEHDLEPFPPPDVFSDPNAPPSINKHVVDHFPVEHHYPVDHHYPVEHHAVKHYAAEYPQAKHAYPVEHHVVAHQPGQEYVYDLSHGHSHLNPHRSLGHYEPTFKVKTKPIIFTEPPPTRPTTTTRATTTTARTTTTRSTTARTTSRPTRRARISARNPAFSAVFTQSSTAASTTEPSTTSTTTRRSIFRSSSERERESVAISERRDELTSAETPQSTVTRSTIAASTTTTTTPGSTTTSTSTTTMPSSAALPSTTTTTTTTPQPTSSTTISTSLPTSTTTPQSTTTSTTTTTPSTTTPTTTTTTAKSTTTTTTTTAKPTTSTTTERPTTQAPSTTTTRSTRVTPAEETTPRTTTLSVDANEIDMRRSTEAPRRRPEPLQDGSSSTIERSYNFDTSESVKVIETTMLIDGKNQTVRFYYITQPVKLPLDVFQKMTGQVDGKPSGMNVIKIRDKRYAHDVSSVLDNEDLDQL